jgi:hypothetical protein
MTPADDGFLVCVRLTFLGQIQVMIQKRGEGGTGPQSWECSELIWKLTFSLGPSSTL